MIEYKLTRCKRKTISVTVADGVVAVKAPHSASIAQIEKFINEKAMWISKKLVEQRRRNDYLRDVIDGKSIMYHGRFLPIVISAEHKRTFFDGNALYIPQKYEQNSAVMQAVASWGKKTAKSELKTALDNLSKRIGLKYAEFSLTNAKTKWGSCDGKCNIMLNWRLIMLDDELVTYVIIHELAHTVHHNHSAAFWSQVGRFMPAYPQIKKRLKTFTTLTALYR